MTIYFDMDGTIVDFYGVEDWLEKLNCHDSSPYAEAAPKLRLSQLARLLNNLNKKGFEIGIISWLSFNTTEAFDDEVIFTKKFWLKSHLPSVNFTEINIVPYGTPKSELAIDIKSSILFDDNMEVRKEWTSKGGTAYRETEIFEILHSLL